MIVEMSRVLVLGPKRLLAQVIDEVQRLGRLHVDRIESEETPQVSAVQLAEDDARALQAAERALARVDGVLALLPAAADATAESVSGPVDDLDAEVAEVERQVRETTRARLELEEERTLIASFEGAVRVLSPLLGALSNSKTLESIGFLLNAKDLTAVAALRNELTKATDGRVEVISRVVDESRVGVVVAFRRHDGDRVRAVLSRAGVTELRLPARFVQEQPQQTIAFMERRKSEIPAQIERLDAELVAVARRVRARLLGIRAFLADRAAQLNVVPELAQSRYTFILHGWAPTRAVSEIRGVLRSRFGGEIVVYDTPADPHDAPERVPVLLDNHPLIRPFQMLLKLFQPPRYGAWDPSPVLAVTFPIFVGLVIGDAGYGLLLFLVGWWLRSKARSGRPWVIRFLGMSLPPQFLADLSYLVRVLAFWIIVFGAVYAEAFGNLPELVFHVEPIYNRVHRGEHYFLLVIAVGIFMIFFGLFVHLVQAMRHRHWVGIFESLVIMLGTGGLLLFLGATGEKLPMAFGPVGIYLFIGAVGVALASFIVDRSVMKQFLWLLESATSFGHILSHARLMAFGLAAAVLGTAANQLGPEMVRAFHVSGVVGRILAFLIAAAGQTFFLVFTIIGHLIQPARLHWVELFMKFKYHEETGRSYRPFQKSAMSARR